LKPLLNIDGPARYPFHCRGAIHRGLYNPTTRVQGGINGPPTDRCLKIFPCKLGLLFVLVALSAFAEDTDTLLNRAENHYQLREQRKELQNAILDYQQALQSDASSYEAAWRLSKAYWYEGNFSTEKKPAFEKGIEAGKKAVEIDPTNCEGHFWLGVNYALLAENSGVFSALGLVDDVKNEITQAMELDQNCQCGGPSRVLGKLYAKLPWFKGGSKKKAVSYLKQSLELCPQDTQSRIFLAEIYEDQGENAEAMRLLQEVEKMEAPQEWLPETKANKISAEKMLHELEKSHGKN